MSLTHPTAPFPVFRAHLAAALILLTSSCIFYAGGSVEKGNPINPDDVARIEVGKTTRSEVFKLLGAPHSIFQGRAEIEEALAFGPPYIFVLSKDKRTFDTIDKSLYAMLYWYRKGSMNAFALVVFAYTQTEIPNDDFLLFLTKETNIVEEAAYRDQTVAP